jgi:hypothetical protein
MSQQVVKLKRTAVEGKVPSTSNIELGELAINTFDGRIFFEKDNGTPSIQQVVTTNSQTTGSLNILGDVTASFFIGNGSQLTNLPNSEISQVATVTASFQEVSSISVNHNFDSRNIIVSVYDSSYSQLIPTSVVLTDNDNVDITLSGPHSGFAVVAKGGHIVSGTLVQEVTEVSTVTASFDNQSTIVVTHSFESKNIIVSVYDSNDSQLIPQSVTLTDLNTATILLSGNHSGFVVVAKGGHLVSGSATTSYTNLTNIPSGIVSGSSQLTSSYDLRYALSGSLGEGGTSDFTELINVPSGLVSSSSQVEFNNINNTPLSQSANNVTISKSLIPTTSTVDLGTAEKPFRDLYLSSASLYIDGQQVISSAANTLTITTDVGQSIKILETEGDDITLQTDTGNIELKGTVEIQSGKKIIDSAGTKILFGDTLGITGSIELTGTVDGVDVAQLKTDIDTLEAKTLISSSQQITDGSGLFSGSFNDIHSNPFTSASNAISTSGHFVPTENEAYDLGSPTQRWRDLYLSGSTIFLGETKITRTEQGDVEFRDRETDSLKKIRVDELEIGSGAFARKIQVDNTGRIKFSDTNDTDKTLDSFGFQGIVTSSNQLSFDEIPGIPAGLISSSFQVNLQETTNYVQGIKTRLNNEAVISGSTISGNKTFNNDVTIAGNLNVQGTTTTFDTTNFNVADNIIELNYGGSATTAGLLVKDATAPNTVSGSLLWDSTNDYWKGGALGSESKLLVAGGDNVISGSSQVVGILSSLNTYTGSNDTTNTTQNSRLTSLETKTGSLDTTNTAQNSRLTSIESATGSYETKGRGIVSGSSQISYTGLSSIPSGIVSGSSQVSYPSLSNIPSGIVSGSSQITLSSTTGYGSVLNQAVLTSSSPTFAGLTINGKATATSTGVDGTFADAYIAQWSGNNNETNAIQTSVSSVAGSSGFKFQVSNGGGSSARTNVANFLRDRVTFNTFVGIGTDDPKRGLHISGTSAGAELTITETTMAVGSKNFNIVGSSANGTWSLRTLTDNSLAQSVNFVSFTAGTGAATFSGNVLPDGNGTRDLGSSTARWSTVYTSDLSLNNGIGDWTIVEGEDDLFLYNNKKGKVYKFALTEVDPNVATPKKS